MSQYSVSVLSISSLAQYSASELCFSLLFSTLPQCSVPVLFLSTLSQYSALVSCFITLPKYFVSVVYPSNLLQYFAWVVCASTQYSVSNMDLEQRSNFVREVLFEQTGSSWLPRPQQMFGCVMDMCTCPKPCFLASFLHPAFRLPALTVKPCPVCSVSKDVCFIVSYRRGNGGV